MRILSGNRIRPGQRQRTGSCLRRAGQITAVALVAAAAPMAASIAASAATNAVSHDAAVPANCVPDIGACGYPDAETTGVPGNVALKEVPSQVSSGPGWTFNSKGYVQVNGNGASLTGLLIPYNVVITASNVTLDDDLLTQGVITGTSLKGRTMATPTPDPGLNVAITLRHTSNVTIEHTTISGLIPASSDLAGGIEDLYGDSTGLTVEANNIADTKLAVEANAGTVDGNYIHSELPNPQGAQIAGIQSTGGSSLMTIEDNTVLVGTSVKWAIGLFTDSGAQANKEIFGNVMAGGNYTLYAGYNTGGPHTSDIVVADNRFSNYYYPNGGAFGPAAHWDAAGMGNVWTDNFWDWNPIQDIFEP